MRNKFFASPAARRAVSAAMAMVIACSMSVPTFAVSRSTLENLVFDSSYYASHNIDVVRALGSSDSALKGHYKTYGRNEGRAPSDVFDPQFYLAAYPDLRAAFGNNYSAALDHFIQYGIAEGRQGSATFNLEVYKDNYADLRQAFGTSSSDNWEYIQHWVQYGRNEHRNAVTRLNNNSSNNSATNTLPAQTTSVKYIKTSNTTSRVNVRSGPSTSHKSLGKLSYGARVEVLSESNGWSKVKACNGLIGYVSSQYLSSSNPSSISFGDSVSTVPVGSTAMSDALYRTSGGRISCGFDGYTTTSGRHEGIDFVRNYGATVYSLTDGVITRITKGSNGSNGLSTIAVYIPSVDKTVVYLHAAPLNSLYEGQTIQRGQQIATEAWRGVSKQSSSHTHVEVRNGRRTGAAKSVGDYTLENTNPTDFWNSRGYQVK